MTELRTPFHVGQSVDDVLRIMKRTNRLRRGMRVKAREGEFFVNVKGKKDKIVKETLDGFKLDMTQNLTIWYYLDDCVLKFKRYRGLDNLGADCYRIVLISKPEDTSAQQTGVVSPSEFAPEPIV